MEVNLARTSNLVASCEFLLLFKEKKILTVELL